MSILSSLLLLFIYYYSLLPLFSSANSSITIPLTRIAPPSTNNNNNNNNPWENLKYQAAASLERARQLKRPNVVDVQLYPRRTGAYTISLSFGTPPQTLSFMMDIGSYLNWFPCTHNYTCLNCDPSSHIPTFIPDSSSSYKPLACLGPQCKWVYPDPYCQTTKNCEYTFSYGARGSTTGQLVSETLTFPSRGAGGLSMNNFTVGCSVSSDNMLEGGGITGFGRSPVSLPTQMGLTSFSYCLLSHDFDDDPTATSDLVLTTTKGGPSTKGVNYTPFANSDLGYYYVTVQSISVGGVLLKVPDIPDPNGGGGGTIVDSSTTFTYMEKPVFDLVFNEFQKQVIGNKLYKRDKRAENETGVGLCYNVGRRNNKTSIKLPQLTFTFEGGVEMVLPLENYFMYVDDHNSVLCMTILNGGGPDGKFNLFPSIILGNYLQRNYYMEYDLENNRLGFRQQICNK